MVLIQRFFPSVPVQFPVVFPGRFLLAGLFLFWGLAFAGAQSRQAYERAGDKAFSEKDYGAAIQYFDRALKRKATDDVRWKYAECARLIHSYPLAEKTYRQIAASANPKKQPPLLNYRLGEVLKNQGKYDAAVESFQRYLEDPLSTDTLWADQARVEIASCRWALEHLSGNQGVEVVNAGKGINSPYSDFAPYLAGDTLFFSSYRFDKRGDRSRPRKKTTKVMFSLKGGRAREATRGFPTGDTVHVAHTAFAAGGSFLFVTLCKNINASDIRCELWLTVQDIRKRWGKPVRLPAPFNVDGYTTTHPSIAFDPLTEQPNLWFASDRPGGKGGLDVWYLTLDTNWVCPCNVPVDSRKPLRMPTFEQGPVNVETINTPGNDITPFFHEDSRTLYFSSDAREGFGGYDIYRSKLTGDGFEPPENAGPGLNTSYNDLYFVLRPDGKSGYLSSNRPGALFLDQDNKACCNDIFSVRYPEPEPPEPSVVTSPTPRQPITRPMIPVEQLQTPEPPPVLADFVGMPLYFDNDEPDKRTRRTETKLRYVETVRAYLERQEEYRERFAGQLKGSQRDAAEQAIDDFFDHEVRRGYERLDQLCELILTRLQNSEQIEVVIKGFTSPRAESDYNLALGKRRISSVRNHFDGYADGAFLPYLRSGQLKVSETSFGETTARAGISDDLKDERNSIYHPDAARERRVEIVEIRESQ